MKRYCWYGYAVEKLIKLDCNIRKSALFILLWLSEHIDNSKIELSIQVIQDEILEEYNKKISLSTIINFLKLLEEKDIIVKIQKGNKAIPTIYKI
jgi:Fe2+ or Zn2+ uptake regulation protein